MIAKEIAGKAATQALVSPAALKLMGLLEQTEVGNQEVVEVLKHDPILTAKLLRACNSASLGFAEGISSVDQAVFLLGFLRILHMAQVLALGDALAVPMPGYAVAANELWRHSVMVAVAAELLSQIGPAPGANPAIAFTAGLLHDIGKLALSQELTAERQASIRYRVAEHGESRIEAEREVLGADHAEVGGCLLSLWRLPQMIVEGVANHHAPVAQPRGRLSAVVYLANCLAHLAGSAQAGKLMR